MFIFIYLCPVTTPQHLRKALQGSGPWGGQLDPRSSSQGWDLAGRMLGSGTRADTNKPCPPPQGKHQLAKPWPSTAQPQGTIIHRIIIIAVPESTDLALQSPLENPGHCQSPEPRANTEICKWDGGRSWDRTPRAGLELWGLAGSEDTQNSLPAHRGAASS